MRRPFYSLILIAILASNFPSYAQDTGPFYSAPTKVNMGGLPVVADIDLFETGAAPVSIALVTDVTKFIEQTEHDLQNFVARRQNQCGERWSTGDPIIEFPQNRIRFKLDLDYQVWNCGLLGRGDPQRIIRETVDLDVTLIPRIEDGKLQAYLGDFSLGERTGVNRYLPIETILRKIVESDLRILNRNAKFYRAPQPFHREGFVYRNIRADIDGERVIITADYETSADRSAIARIGQALRDEGIISER